MRIRRTQPPVGYRVPFPDVARAAAGRSRPGESRALLEQEVASHFGVRRAVAVSSGKAALAAALAALHALTGRRKVILPAYTCYSVPSAIVKAGLIPLPCDIARGTFDYDYGRLQEMLTDGDVLCALSIHLFGIAADTHRLNDICRPAGIFVVEDAAQAMGGAVDGRLLGTRADVGFFSLGRGKNLTCGSGGLILTSSPDIAARLGGVIEDARNGIADDLKAAAELSVMSMFISPRLYWFPAGIPALKLGETIFHPDFPVRALSDFRARLLAGWRERLGALSDARRRAAEFYRRHVAAASARDADVAYLRFPLIASSPAARARILEAGRVLGIGRMYPASVGSIPEIQGMLSQRDFPEAERVASLLVTLPTHPLLTAEDRQRVCDVVNASAADPLTAVDDQRVAVKAN